MVNETRQPARCCRKRAMSVVWATVQTACNDAGMASTARSAPGRLATAMWATFSSSCQRCQVGNPSQASAPKIRRWAVSGSACHKRSNVRIVQEGPACMTSASSMMQPGSSPSANRTMASRSLALACGKVRCGGCPAGTQRTLSR